MKKYEQPAIELIKFSIMDVLTASKTQNDFNSELQGDANKAPQESFDELFGL